MNDIRTTDLEAAGVVRDGTRIVHFGDPAAEARAALDGDAVFDLRHLALIAVDGDDAEEFLQGQLTSDLRDLTETRAQPSAWCSPKGRVLTCFLVFRHHGRLLLQLPQSTLEQTLKRMRMFVLRARVTLEDAGAAWMCMGVVGSAAESCLKDAFGDLPEHTDALRSVDGVTVIHLRGRRPRYEIIGEPGAVARLWNTCRRVAVAAGADAWGLLDIEAGVADIGPATSDAFVPQMINLDRIGAVSFTKGCYVGQEIVARTQHLGRIKRRMYRAHWNGASCIGPGDTLEGSAAPAPFRAKVVNAKAVPTGGFDLLAVIPIDVADALPASGLALDDGARLMLEPLPYALDDETG
jgi:tRNA-modifying protein YgfZ